MRLHKFFRTTTFRLALLYAALFSASVLALFAFIYGTTKVLIDRERQNFIAANVASLRDLYEAAGLSGLAEGILARTQPDRVGDNLYLLADDQFQPLAGNGTAWPRFAQRDGAWLIFPVERRLLGDPEIHLAQALHVVLPNGFHLLVGQDMRAQERFQRAVVETLIWSMAITLCLGLLVGLVMSRNALHRIEAINEAAERVMHGEFKHRIPTRGAAGGDGDEFDRLAENLNRMLEQIERLMGSMRAVTHNIAHDLRSPLTRVKTRLESALATMAEGDPRRQAIEQAVGEADELLATFNALLSIADAEAGAGRTEMTPVDLAALLRDVAELYEPVAEERGFALETALAEPALVQGNRQLLFQAATNLVDNALKHAGPGGRIRLAVSAAADGGGGGPEIVVADSGPGVPEADRGRVLERFVRLDPSRSTPGSGLGLSLVAAIVRLHKASLALEDNAPGLRVRIRFPTAAAAPA